jgi:hypothetical protein
MVVCSSRKSHKKPQKNICVKPYKVCVEQCKVCASIICFFPCCLALKDVPVSIITLRTDALADWMRACLATVRPWHRRPLDHILFGKYIQYRQKAPNDLFFWHNFFVCEYFSNNFSGFMHNMNTHIHKLLPGIYRYLYISWIKKSKNESMDSFRTL